MFTAYENNKILLQKTKPTMSYNGIDFEKWQPNAKNKLKQLL